MNLAQHTLLLRLALPALVATAVACDQRGQIASLDSRAPAVATPMDAASQLALKVTGIAFEPPNVSVAAGESFRVVLEGPSVIDTTVIDATAVASLNVDDGSALTMAAGAAGTFTTTRAGDFKVHAMLGNYAADLAVSVKAPEIRGMSVEVDADSIAIGQTTKVRAYVILSDHSQLDVSQSAAWSAGDAKLVSFPAHADVKGVAAGATTVTASLYANTASAAVTVVPSYIEALRFTSDHDGKDLRASVVTALGESAELYAFSVGSDGSIGSLRSGATFAWSTPDFATAALDKNGVLTITPKTAGTAVLTVTIGGVSGEISVAARPAEARRLEIAPEAPAVVIGRAISFHAIATFSDRSQRDFTSAVTWTSSTPSIAHYEGDAQFSGLFVGVTSIHAVYGDVESSTTLTVSAAVPDHVSIAPSDDDQLTSVPAGRTSQFKAVAIYTDGTSRDVTSSAVWASQSPTTAAVDDLASRGLVTAVQSGRTSITATYEGVVATLDFTVLPPVVVSVAITPANAAFPLYGTANPKSFQATALYSDGNTANVTADATWYVSSNPPIISVSNANGARGRTSSFTTGAAVLTAALGVVTGSTTVTITPKTVVSIRIAPSTDSGTTTANTDLNLDVAANRSLSAQAIYSDGSTGDVTTNAQLSWSEAPSGFLSVGQHTGVMAGLSEGSSTVTATIVGIPPVSVRVAVRSSCGTPGVRYDYYCWYLGQDGDSCTQTCSILARADSNATISLVGSGGSAGGAACRSIMAQLMGDQSLALDTPNQTGGPLGLGCYRAYFDPVTQYNRVSSPVTNFTDASPNLSRVCACH